MAWSLLYRKTKRLTGGNILRWMETIKVQSGPDKANTAEKELIFLAREIQKYTDPQKLPEAMVVRNTLVPGFFALNLFWNTDEPRIGGTALGLSLAQNLKAFGLVDHSVWIESSETEGGNDHGKHNRKEKLSFES
jgi:hypothetical protein